MDKMEYEAKLLDLPVAKDRCGPAAHQSLQHKVA